MGNRKSHNPRNRHRPTPAFWIKVGLALSVAQLFPGLIGALLTLAVLALPASLFRP
jgi:hypothetical protein